MKKIYVLVALAMLTFSVNAKNAYLLLASSISNLPEEVSETDLGNIPENPEQNAANWYNNLFVKNNTGVLLTTDQISSALANGISCIWVNIDRVGLEDIVNAGITDAVIADLKAYVEAGGNLLLTKQATMIAYRIGRIYQPTYSYGGYHLGNDIWSINPQLGLWYGIEQHFDRSNHPVYEGVEWCDTLQTYKPSEEAEPEPYKVLPLVGAVPRTDNNCAWLDLFRKDPENPTEILPETEGVTHYNNGDVLRLTEFEEDWNVQMLACWGQVLDFCSAGLVDMNPDGDFQGRIIGLGFAAYQWGNSNDYIDNVKKLTRNSLNYLTAEETAVENVELDPHVQGIYNIFGQKVESMQAGQLYIVNGKKVMR
ncbi:MAG: hypothetical protein IJU36_00705 [Paludibacteraceae bacterium]|nr:hypothetical protein [Paludibacteraceae bacterium]